MLREHPHPREARGPVPARPAGRVPADAMERTAAAAWGPRALRACATSAPVPRSNLDAITPAPTAALPGQALKTGGTSWEGCFRPGVSLPLPPCPAHVTARGLKGMRVPRLVSPWWRRGGPRGLGSGWRASLSPTLGFGAALFALWDPVSSRVECGSHTGILVPVAWKLCSLNVEVAMGSH